jgi:hypothetical protein
MLKRKEGCDTWKGKMMQNVNKKGREEYLEG